MIRLAAALAVLGACSFGMQGVDPKWDGSSEPPACSDATIMLDRAVGAGALIAGIGSITADKSSDASLLVGGAAIGMGLLYWLAATSGSKIYTACQTARMRWAYSNAIKARAPRSAPATAAAPPASGSAAATPPPAAGAGPAPRPISGQGGDARPWAKGVPQAEQAIALQLFEAGNREFVQARHPQALVKYREAIEHWDHPAIRFNIAVCLFNLGRLVEARNNLERGMAYGPAALDDGMYARGEMLRARLDARLARLTLDCPEPGEQVMIDGELVFTGPGTIEIFVLPGEHNIVATKPGFLPATRKVVLVTSQRASYEIRPFVDPRPARP